MKIRLNIFMFLHIESVHPDGETKVEKQMDEMENGVEGKQVVYVTVSLHASQTIAQLHMCSVINK